MYDNYFSNFGRPPVSDDVCIDSATRHPQFWRRRFLMVFTIYGLGGHLGQLTTTILAILVDLPSPKTYAKIQPQGILGSGEEDF